MPAKIRQKLDSKRGATLLLALMLFLVCAMVGSAVVAAAYTNAGRYANNKAAQQSYLAVMSAARLVQEDFQNMTLEGSYLKTITETQIPVYDYVPVLDADGNPVMDENNEAVTEYKIVDYYTETTTDYTAPVSCTSLSGSALVAATLADQLVSSFKYYHTPLEVSGGLIPSADIELPMLFEASDFDFPAVTGTMKVYCVDDDGDSHFDIEVTLCDAENGANAITMTFPVQITQTYDVSEEAGKNENDENYTKTHFTYGIIASWVNPEITKGAGI